MTAIWHDTGAPSFFSVPPSFSFQDIAQIVAPAPTSYELYRAKLQRWERRLGAAWYVNNANLAHQFYLSKREWWLNF